MSSHKINRRQAIAAAGAGLVAGAAWGQAQAAAKPNIVFMVADDLGYADVSCYGRREYKTPNIDRLAAEGMMFMQAYANSSVCSATRTALITGRYQYRLPVGLEEPLGGPNRGVGLPPEHPTLPSLLRKAGYGTTLLGKWHLGYLPKYGPLQSGYEHFWGFRGGGVDYFTHKSGNASSDTDDLWEQDVKVSENGYLTELLGKRAVKVIDGYAKEKKPFLLSLHFNAPHWPWEGPKDEAESKRVAALTDYDGGTLKTFGEMVTAMDREIGNVLASLDRNGIANNTIVIFTSDNGGERFSDTWPFTGHKTELLEGGLRIPMLVRWPARVRKGSVSQQVTMSMDWLPTLTAAAGTAPDAAYPPDGMNLMPQLTAGAAPVSRKVYWRYRYNSQRAMRDGDLKWLKIRDNTWLFNVVEDPLEKANLSKRRAEDYRRMVADYEQWSSTMLPEDPQSNSAGLPAVNNPDRPNNPRQSPAGQFDTQP
jgi:arylsulfatase A-like enzyme